MRRESHTTQSLYELHCTKSDYHLLAVGHVLEVLYAFLQCSFNPMSSRKPSFISEQGKRYFIGRHSLPREGYVVGVKQSSPGLQFRRTTCNIVPELCVCLQLFVAVCMCECVRWVCEWVYAVSLHVCSLCMCAHVHAAVCVSGHLWVQLLMHVCTGDVCMWVTWLSA